MSAGIQHLLKGGRESNRIGESRVDKIETDRLNSIVERISGVNPSKLAALVTKEEVQTFPGARVATSPVEKPAAGPGPRLGSQAPWEEPSGGSNATVDQLAKQVQMLERRLAKYEVFNGNDNDVVSTTTTPAAKLNRGADSSAYGSGAIRKKNAKSKDPVDGKPDKQTEPNMAGERVNILGVSMNEWRSLAGLSAPVLKAPAVVESVIEDEFEEDDAAPVPSTNEHQLWAQFLANYDTTPEAFAEFAEAASQNDDEDAILAIQALEDEFIEAIGAEPDAPMEEDVDQLWSQWLEARDLSVETFNALVDAAETEEDVATLESLQSMFEAEIAGKRIAGSSPAPGGDKEVAMPGQKPQKLTSLAHGQVKPSRKGNFSLPASMRAKMGLPKEEDNVEEDEDFFECDSDESGGPDMKHPGWAKAMSKFKKGSKKAGRKS